MTQFSQVGYNYIGNKIPDKSVVMPKQVQYLHKIGNLHPACYECINRKRTQTDGDGFKKGDFICNCEGIPLDYTKTIRQDIWNGLSTKEQEDYVCSQDPVYFAWKYLNWYPRKAKNGIEYQAILMRCTANRVMARWGRRMGKSEALAAKILWHAFYHSGQSKTGKEAAESGEVTGDILIVAPFQYQVKNLFDKIRKMVNQGIPEIKDSIIRDVKNPHEMTLINGTQLKGRSSSERSGSKGESIRSEGASLIVYDEMDYLDNDTVKTVNAVLTGNENHGMIGASTPRGSRDSEYYDWCNSPMASEFWYPSVIAPSWTPQTERELLLKYDRMTFQREFLAEWGEIEGGVFPVKFVDIATADQNYKYGTNDVASLGWKPNWTYSIGVDWNHRTGTQIVVLGLEPESRHIFVVDRANVDAMEFKQTQSVLKIRELSRTWKPEWIYCDEGFGMAQIEQLHILGLQSLENYARNPKTADKYSILDGRLKDIVKGVNSSSNLEIFDPSDGQSRKVPAKQVMVQNAMRRFERESIHFPLGDVDLRAQLLGYIEKRITSTGMPVYAARSESVGDHIIDALFLALWAFTKEMGVLGGPNLELQMSYTSNVLFNGLGGTSVELRDIEYKNTSFAEYNTSENFSSVIKRGFGDNETELSPEARYSMGSLIDKNISSRWHKSRRTGKLDPELDLIKGVKLNGPTWGRKVKRSFSREI